jgi:FkbM family methyltransferase
MFHSISINGRKKLYANDCANDLWISEVVFPGKRKGYFVEAGAADGMGGSSCFFLEKKLGWKGICIEPSEQFFKLLSEKRPKSIHVNACLASSPGTVEFVEAPLDGEMSPYLSGVRDVLLRFKHEAEAVVDAGKTVSRPSVRLVDVLDVHKAPHDIEYGAFDIEGSEYEALRDFPFDRYRFLALSFEVDSRIEEPLHALLIQNGYVRTQNPYNHAFPAEQYWLHKSIADKPPVASWSRKLAELRDRLHDAFDSLAAKFFRTMSSS